MLCARREEWLTPTVERFRHAGIRVEGVVADVVEARRTSRRSSTRRCRPSARSTSSSTTPASPGARGPRTCRSTSGRRSLDVNLTGAFLFAQAAGREMLKREYGRIINVASIAGLHASVRGPHYAALRRDQGGPDGADARAGGVVGAAEHPRQRDRARASSTRGSPTRRFHLAEPSIKASCPIPRVGAAGELKGVAVFLAADASNYITGQIIVVDGGRTIADDETGLMTSTSVAVRGAAVAEALRLLGASAHDVPGAAAVRDPRDDGRRDAGRAGDAFLGAALTLPRDQAARRSARRGAACALGVAQGRSRRHHAAELPAVHHRGVRHPAARAPSSSTSTRSTPRASC